MQKIIQEDSNLRSFFDYLYIEKGLSQNTVQAYETDILSFLNWLTKTPNINYLNLKEDNINKYIAYLFKSLSLIHI